MSHTVDEELLGHLFTVVIPQADFSGRPSSAFDDLQHLVGKYPPLLDACLALSAIWVKSLRKQTSRHESSLELAHKHYDASIKGVKTSIEHFNRQDLLPTLWTVLLLSLFELMTDASGDNWIRHILYGISKTLEHSGTSSLRSPSAKRFFREVRIFEISRSLIFNTPTFLALPEWRSYTQEVWQGEDRLDWTQNEGLYDILIDCSDLSYKTTNLLFSPSVQGGRASPTVLHSQLQELAVEGARLANALNSWPFANPNLLTLECSPTNFVDAQAILGSVFHAAASIFVSGIFDYYRWFWDDRKIFIPTLDPHTVSMHVSTILSLVSLALGHTNLSPVLFLFPLRVAGARSFTLEERCYVRKLLDQVSVRYVVAGTFVSDLESHWES